MILARGRYFMFAFFLILASGIFTALPASAVPISVTDTGGITYTADDALPGDGATVTGFTGAGAVTIPDTIEISGTNYDVVSISDQVFQNKGVTAVTIGNNVKTIGLQAFYDNQIVNLTLGSSVVSIGNSAFRDNQLTAVTIPASVTSIDQYAFDINQIASLTLGSSVQTIGAHAFDSNRLTAVAIPDSVTSIDDYAFYGGPDPLTDNQISSLTLGNSIQTIGEGTFRRNQLKTLIFPASITSIGEVAFVENPGLGSVIFTGPAPAVFPMDSGSRSFPYSDAISNPNLKIKYTLAHDVSNGGGFDTPVWQKYPSAIRVPVTASFNLNGHGTTAPSDQTVLEGDKISAPLTAPADPNWVFKGWFADTNGTTVFNFNDPITANTVVYAGWEAVGGPGGGGPGTTKPDVDRYSGSNRYSTAVDISKKVFKDGADAVYVASGLGYADGLAGGPSAAKDDGPLLLTGTSSIHSEVITEIKRLEPKRIIVLGGPASVSPSVSDVLAETAPVTRLGGLNRYGTAAEISKPWTTPSTVYIASGENFPDALSGSALAAHKDAPLLLTRNTVVPVETLTALGRLKPTQIVIVGGTGVISAATASTIGAKTGATVTRIAGADRYETSSKALAASGTLLSGGLMLASGNGFADALAGTPAATKLGVGFALVQLACTPPSLADLIKTSPVSSFYLLGGLGVLKDSVLTIRCN